MSNEIDYSEERIKAFKKKFPSLKWILRTTVDTSVFKADSEVISLADVENNTVDKEVLIGALEKFLSVVSKDHRIADLRINKIVPKKEK